MFNPKYRRKIDKQTTLVYNLSLIHISPEGLIYIDDIALGLEADVAAFMTATDAAATEPEPTDPDDESSFMAFAMEDETKLPLTSFDRVSTERCV